jgi:glyoxylase-like metal-dependent hydrolase (beta-lactamase superfamily II)
LRRLYITHADLDHVGLLNRLGSSGILVNAKSADNFRRQHAGLPDYREMNGFCLGYTKLNRILSCYNPPDLGNLIILDHDTPDEHNNLLKIGEFVIGDMIFDVYEGSGGHVHGEMFMICREGGVAFTGDNLVNISGFTPERAKFNSLAPYLMRSVNVNSEKAIRMRKEIIELISENETTTGKKCIICGGHGPLSELKDGKIVSLQ